MFFHIVQIILAIPLIFAILLQARGAGLSSIFGGEGNVFHTRRGIEKSLFIATIINAVLFFSLALVTVILSD